METKPVSIPTTRFGSTGVEVGILAQGGARMDLHPDIPAAAAHVRRMVELGITCFDCARLYWGGLSEEAYGIGLEGVRQQVFLTTKTPKRTTYGTRVTSTRSSARAARWRPSKRRSRRASAG